MLCDACRVRPEWKGEHKCHAPGPEPAPMVAAGFSYHGVCECKQCKPPTEEELAAFRKMHEETLERMNKDEP